jgi:hypothetical protein
MDRCLGECPNSFAYEIPRGHANPVRALVFDKNPITAVQFRIDGSTTWQDMQRVDGGPVWQGFWDTTTTAVGTHTIEVWASGTAADSDTVVTSINPSLCLGDQDRDGDVDGRDLAEFTSDFVREVTRDVGAEFGKTNCN